MFRTIFFLFFISVINPLIAQPVIDISKSSYVNIGKSTLLLEDKTAKLSLNDIIEGKYNGAFIAGKKDVDNWGISKSAFWVKLKYQSVANETVFLVIDQANIDTLEVYTQRAGEQYSRVNSGSLAKGSTEAFNSTSFIFTLPAAVDSPGTVYLRVRTGNITVLPIKLMDARGLSEAFVQKYTIEAIYIGIIFALLIFTITIFLILKDVTYFYYVGYIFCLAVYIIAYLMGYSHLMGHSFQHFLVRYAHIFALADYVFAILFALSFLRVWHYMPRMIPVFHVVIALCGIGIVSSILGFRSVAVGFVQLLGVVFPISLLYISIIIYRKGFWPARFYIPAWTLVLGSVGYTILCFQGVFPVTDSTFMAIPYGSTVELFFLCFALADRIRQLKEEKQSAIEKNLELVSKLNVVLENKVALRTTELNETLSDLRDSNAIKDRLFSMVTHDVRSPVGNLYNMICMLESNVMTQKDFNDMLPLIKEDTAQLMNNLTKLLRWASGQITHTVFRPELVNLSRFFEEHVDMYKYLAYVKRIEIKIVCDEGMVVYVDPNYLSVVYRNLIDNAIKFTPPGGEVEMGCRGMNGMYMLYLKNSGTPLSQEKIDTILSTNEGPTVAADGSSTGLGLQLCKEFLIRLGSSLMIKNEPDTGVLFYFMLPVTTATTIEKGNRLLPQLPFEEDINNNN